MPFARPPLSELVAETAADIKAALPGANPLLRRAVLTILSRVLAGEHHEQFGYIDWLARMAVPFTSRGEFLQGWAALKGVKQEPATNAVLGVTLTGTPGKTVSDDATLTREDGTLYTAAVGGTLDDSGTLILSVTAIDTGTGPNCALGAALSLSLPVAGVNSAGTVTDLTTPGTDLEDDDSLLSRTLVAYASPPEGGDLDDYARWARDVPGVTRAWVLDSAAGAGTVTLYFMMDTVRSSNYGLPLGSNGVSASEARGLAASGDQLVVADTIYSKRGATALVYACAPVAAPLAITLAEVPNDSTNRGAIAAAIAGYCIRKAAPGGTWLPVTRGRGGIQRVSDISAAIAAAPGLDHFVMTSPSVDVINAVGFISVPAPVIYL